MSLLSGRERVLAGAAAIYAFMGDARTKNMLLVILMCLTAFGMLAPETATSLRDLILAMIF